METFDLLLGFCGFLFAITALRSLLDKNNYSKKGFITFSILLLMVVLCFGLKSQLTQYVEISNSQYVTIYKAITQHPQADLDRAIVSAMTDNMISKAEFDNIKKRFPESFTKLNKAPFYIDGSPAIAPLKMEGLQASSLQLLNMGSSLVGTAGIVMGGLLLLFAIVTYATNSRQGPQPAGHETDNLLDTPQESTDESIFSTKGLTIASVMFLVCGFAAYIVGSNFSFFSDHATDHQITEFIQAYKNSSFIQNLYAEISADGKVSTQEMNQLINAADTINGTRIKAYLGQQH